MVYFTDAKTYFEQSKLLLQARPSTTKISTKYTVPKPTAKRTKSLARRRAKTEGAAPGSTEDASASTATPTLKAILTLRTYDPVSGTVLKYQTDKQAEVGRLIAGLGRCARTMAALPEEVEPNAGEVPLEGNAAVGSVADAMQGVVGAAGAVSSSVAKAVAPVQGGQQDGQGSKTGGGGGKKKKKNKK